MIAQKTPRNLLAPKAVDLEFSFFAIIHQLSSLPLEVIDKGVDLKIEGHDFVLVFDQVFGTLKTWKYAEEELIVSGPILDFWRAPTNNDTEAGMWKEYGLHWLKQRVESFQWELSDHKEELHIVVKTRMAPPNTI